MTDNYWLPDFFLSTIVTPVTAELAAVARDIDGVGCMLSNPSVREQSLTFMQMRTSTVCSILRLALDL